MRTMAVVLMVVLAGLLVAAGTGCAANPVVGTRGNVQAQQYFGDVGVTGHNQNVTLLTGSRVRKLSILGDRNTVTVQDEVTIYRVEFWGSGNTISIPEHLSLRVDDIGNNQILRRPREVSMTPEPTRFEQPPPAVTTSPIEPATPPQNRAAAPAVKPVPRPSPPARDPYNEPPPPVESSPPDELMEPGDIAS
jgi:hypothetical protein